MKTNKVPGKPIASLSDPEISVPLARSDDWRSLLWLAFVVCVGLTGFEWLKHFLFPQFTSLQNRAVTVCVGTIAAVIGSYYLNRKLDRVIALHSDAEKKLALERNVLRTVTDNIPDSIFAKDTEGRYIFANKAFAAIHGMKSPAELMAKTAFDLFPKDQANTLHGEDLLVMRTGGAPVETERTAANAEGQPKILQTTKVPLIDKNDLVIGVVGLHRDVTRRREAERKLRQSEANLAAAQRIAHFGSVELDLATIRQPEKKPVRWSDEVFRIFGYNPGEVESSRETYFRGVHPEDRERVREALDAAMKEVKAFTIDFRIVRPDGTVRNLQERGDIFLDPVTHKPLKLVASIQDVTELVQAELRLQRANRELGDRLRELQQRSLEISILSEMGSRLQVCNSADEAHVEIGHAAEQLFPQWSGSLCVISSSRTAVETAAVWGNMTPSERVFPPDDCWALRRGQPQTFRRGERAGPCRHIQLSESVVSLCVPLMAQGEALGIVNLQASARQARQETGAQPSDEGVRRLAMVLAEQVALALGNLRLRETLRNQSICDPLTGLFNRRYMEESLEREFSRANRSKSCVAIVMMDIDHFKRFNDTYGHQAGDALLRALGDLLKKTTRGQDIACRYGGEEFSFVLTDASMEGAVKRAEAMRQDVRQLAVEHAGQLLGAISVSMGVALYPDHGGTMGEVVRAADQALYAAKRKGRDCVCAWTAESVV